MAYVDLYAVKRAALEHGKHNGTNKSFVDPYPAMHACPA